MNSKPADMDQSLLSRAKNIVGALALDVYISKGEWNDMYRPGL